MRGSLVLYCEGKGDLWGQRSWVSAEAGINPVGERDPGILSVSLDTEGFNGLYIFG